MEKLTHQIHANIQGWFNYADLYTQIAKDPKFNKIVEVGTWKGKSAMYMAVELALSERAVEFYCVDTWEGSGEHQNLEEVKTGQLFNIFLKNIEPVKNYIIPIRKASLEAVKDFANGSLDFVFIDASHEYKDVKADLSAWWPKIKPDGMLTGHDFNWGGVRKAVYEFAKENELKALGISETCWHVAK
jgi:predicted O-methyltransferase YrrM